MSSSSGGDRDELFDQTTFTTAATISAPQYWSNRAQRCVTGFTDATTPTPGPLQIGDTGVTITGTGFGSLPSLSPLGAQYYGTSGTLPIMLSPYITIQNDTGHFEAGNILDMDRAGLTLGP